MNPSSGVVFHYKPKEGAEELIYQRISDLTISMKALDYLNMPDCIPTRYEVEMNTDERKLYDMLKHDLLIPLKGWRHRCCQRCIADWKIVADEQWRGLKLARAQGNTVKKPGEVVCFSGTPFFAFPIGAEALNPHECRGKLRKSQEMRRTLGCAVLRI